ncbi:LLM class F420-dependent oxidoreductase [Streptomyces tsukubensis]|uniref:LLM class F420-dependent oxidoreductase n=1 Tax=Streptomyces tsukubensis TaxID=83656 RepID=A0A1V4AGA0_9ACTN|nr:LLM class F420-dependent oxidoreductase [Streptomyces tsukubensis]OON82631.1 LLM class F420-dependent oxidoreductase [Streptomyces tsukubensis]QFR92197.1 TIGR03620 family F420-dependent LLM class oxidoreductase [Streptomyces tsukubensis]
MEIGRVGIWNPLLASGDPEGTGEAAEATAELEQLGYGAVWLGGNSSVPVAADLVRATSRIVVATGILSIWDYDAPLVAEQCAALSATDPGRFLLGLGASHSALAKNYHKPYSSMVAYLDALDSARSPVPREGRVLAALGPKMLKLAGERAAGAHPYLVTPEHTALARQALGADALLAPEVKVVFETDAEKARSIARSYLEMYLGLPNYTNNWLRLGFSEDDFKGGGSDRLIDANVIWGDESSLREGVAAYHEAGADHVAVQVLTEDMRALPRAQWRELAGVLELS